jgi:hypothetical protein
VSTLAQELDGLIDAGIEYVYFIDEIFLPNQELLGALFDEFGDIHDARPRRLAELETTPRHAAH